MFKASSLHYLSGTFTARQLGILKKRVSQESIRLSDKIEPSVTTYLVGRTHKDAIEAYNGKINDDAELISHQWIYDSMKEKQELPKNIYAVDWKKIITAGENKQKDLMQSKKRKQPSSTLKPIKLPSYACQRATSDRNNKNGHITEKLEAVERAYSVLGDDGRSLSYRRAIAAIKACPETLQSGKQLSQVRFIGKKMVMKIDSIIKSGTFEEMEIAEQEHVKALTEFTSIYGVGSKTANSWYDNGYRTIKDLRNAGKSGEISLSDMQKIALDNYDAMKEKISMEDKNVILRIFQKCLHDIDPKYEMHVAGEFRRGKGSSGKLELLIKDVTSYPKREHFVLDQLVKKLENKSIKHILRSTRTKIESDDGVEYSDEDVHPRCDVLVEVANRPLRHVVLVLVPENEWGFGLIEWTGSNHFKRDMKLYAREKKRCKLGIHYITNKKGDVVSIDGSMEENVFNYLGLDYRQPYEREC